MMRLKECLAHPSLGENEHIQNAGDPPEDQQPGVRCEVMERIGWSGDPKLGAYLVNHFRHNEAKTAKEKRTLALNLARIDIRANLPIFNAMLGKLATDDARFTKRFKPMKGTAIFNWRRWKFSTTSIIERLGA